LKMGKKLGEPTKYAEETDMQHKKEATAIHLKGKEIYKHKREINIKTTEEASGIVIKFEGGGKWGGGCGHPQKGGGAAIGGGGERGDVPGGGGGRNNKALLLN